MRATALSPSGGDTALCQPRAASRSMSPRWGSRPKEQREFRGHRTPGAHALVLTIIFSRLKVHHPGVYRLFARRTW
jgi:hypothetical protein